MAFNWVRFLEHNGIAYSTSGTNVSRGNLVVHCPFCGSEDEGMHMSIATDGRGWRCFRRHDHSGKSPIRLICGLLGCTIAYARSLVGGVSIPDDFAGTIARLMAPKENTEQTRKLRLPKEFREIVTNKIAVRPYREYLRERGFTDRQIGGMTERYDMRYCVEGAYRGRIVFPVECGGQLVSFTGRSIYKSATLRYKSLSHDREKAESEGLKPALGPISHFLLWYDDLLDVDCDTIVMCEGPFDALKVDVLGKREGICATCFFTSGPTSSQIDLLHELLPRFKRRLLLLDAKTLPNAIRIQGQLSGLGVRVVELRGVKDPGALRSRTQLLQSIY